jgi:histone H3/H4
MEDDGKTNRVSLTVDSIVAEALRSMAEQLTELATQLTARADELADGRG